MAPKVLYRVIHGTPDPPPWQSSLLTIRSAVLHGYGRHKVRDCDYPAIIPQQDSVVRGTFVSGLTEGDVWRLDIFEGDEYIRKKVRVRLLDKTGDEKTGDGNVEGEELRSDTYVWVAGEERLEKEEWDFAMFQREKMSRWIGKGGEEEYRDVDAAVSSDTAHTGRDPMGARGPGGRIAHELNAASF
ncbi:MAG: hypothetical protein M1824_000256 [Vezdaea acicularis]|nr:MAG: hypothetical protein M1824_000256 [Vezdaea acicularis]